MQLAHRDFRDKYKSGARGIILTLRDRGGSLGVKVLEV